MPRLAYSSSKYRSTTAAMNNSKSPRSFSGMAGEHPVFAAYLAVMVGVCLLACLAPTNRALRIEPARALKEEG